MFTYECQHFHPESLKMKSSIFEFREFHYLENGVFDQSQTESDKYFPVIQIVAFCLTTSQDVLIH